MSDIVERLRNGLLKGDDPRLYMLRNADIAEAAGEIERLRAENTDLRAALDRIMVGDDAGAIARAALEGKP